MSVVAPQLMPALKDICVEVVARNFEQNPSFGPLPDRYVRKITSILSLDLPLELVGSLINDEEYWRRRSNARWKNTEPTGHGNSYKQMFFERNLQDAIEQYSPAIHSEHDLRRLMSYSRRFVQTLTLRQLPSHMDLGIIFDCMISSPSTLSVHYNLQNVGMEYDRSLFGMKLADCRSLAKALESNETLTHLDVSNNALDDDKVRMLASGLVENMTITHLNMSHNKVADRGMRALAKLLDAHSVIAILELQDNQIHTEGAKLLARALKTNQALISIDLRLNRMGDDGCKALCDALRHNTSVQRLNLAANSASKNTAGALGALLRSNSTLTQLDVSCNSGLGQDGCEQLRRAIESNSSLLLADVRQCGADPDDEFAIAEALRGRLEKQEKARLLSKS